MVCDSLRGSAMFLEVEALKLQENAHSNRSVWQDTVPACTHQTQLPSADCSGFRILNIFEMDSRPTIVKSVVESADSGIEWADSIADSASNPLRIGLWVRALNHTICLHSSQPTVFLSMKKLWKVSINV